MNLNQITVPSTDVAASIHFYKELGLQLIVHTHDAYARFECPDGESTFSIHQVDSLPSGEGIFVYFETERLDEEVSRLRENGLTFDLLPTDQRWRWREAHLKDPSGNQIVLYYAGTNRKNPPWRLEEATVTAEKPIESVEIERKFLTTSAHFKTEAHKTTTIKQGYLSKDPERTVRVRIKGKRAYLTIKGKSNDSGTTRVEVEEEIAFAKAEILISLCLPGIIDKTRYEVNVGNHVWEIDEFYGENQGLTLAEIELSSETEAYEKPAWLGEEVTGDARYYNSQLSEKPYKNW